MRQIVGKDLDKFEVFSRKPHGSTTYLPYFDLEHDALSDRSVRKAVQGLISRDQDSKVNHAGE